MAIPSQGEFSEFLALADTPVSVSATLPEGFTIEDAVAFAIQADTDCRAVAQRLDAMPALQWLVSQREFQRADEIVRGTRRRSRRTAGVSDEQQTSREDRIRQRVTDVFRRYSERRAQRQNDHWDAWDLRRAIERFSITKWGDLWLVNCLRAVAEYLDGTTGKELIQAVRGVEQLHAELIAAARRYSDAANRINSSGITGLRVSPPSRYVGRYMHRPLFDAPHDVSFMPFKRDDDSVAERLFVYRLWSQNRIHFRTPKTEAIAELMGLEGFRRSYDTRTIERLCSGFRESYRRYWVEYRRSTAGAS